MEIFNLFHRITIAYNFSTFFFHPLCWCCLKFTDIMKTNSEKLSIWNNAQISIRNGMERDNMYTFYVSVYLCGICKMRWPTSVVMINVHVTDTICVTNKEKTESEKINKMRRHQRIALKNTWLIRFFLTPNTKTQFCLLLHLLLLVLELFCFYSAL